MSEQHGKTYRPWEPERYQHAAPSPAAKLPEGDVVFCLLDTVRRLDLGRFYAPYEQKTRGAPLGSGHLCVRPPSREQARVRVWLGQPPRAAPHSPIAERARRANRSQDRQTTVGHTRTNAPGLSRSIGLAAAGLWEPHAHAGPAASAPSRPSRPRRSGGPPLPRSAGPPRPCGRPNADANPERSLRSTSARHTPPPPA